MSDRPLLLQQVKVSETPPRDGHGVNTGTIHPLAELYTRTLLSGPSGRLRKGCANRTCGKAARQNAGVNTRQRLAANPTLQN